VRTSSTSPSSLNKLNAMKVPFLSNPFS
jgi:hypothetical protein